RYADAWVPHSSATPEEVQRDWAVIERAAPEFGRRAADIRVVYSNFVHVLARGERPAAAAPRFRTFSGMDLAYWQEPYLPGRAPARAAGTRPPTAPGGGGAAA